jgi:hypothetical protein
MMFFAVEIRATEDEQGARRQVAHPSGAAISRYAQVNGTSSSVVYIKILSSDELDTDVEL